jgi:hypothetical protein
MRRVEKLTGVLQIWFQNRRQNTRRKSRPLLPHEMVPHFRNSIPHELLHESTPTSHGRGCTPQTSFSSVEDVVPINSSSTKKSSVSRASSIHDLLNPVDSFESTRSTSFESYHNDHASTLSRQSKAKSVGSESFDTSRDCRNKPATSSPCSKKLDDDDSMDEWAKTGCGRGSNKSSDSAGASKSSIEETMGAPAAELSSQHLMPCDPQAARRKRGIEEVAEAASQSSQTSIIRLSMTVDGAVKVRTTDQDTPSPPKQRPQSPAILQTEGLRRSHSSIAASEERKEGQMSTAKPSSGIFGRSRDARTWEFYCDVDARAALSAQAENENNGSAVSAINLIRSRSRNAKSKAQQEDNVRSLKPKIGPGNARKHGALAEQKSKMVPAASSTARVFGNCKTGPAERQKTVTKPHARAASGDSDKENWAPGTRSSTHPLRQRQASTRASHAILQDHLPGASSKTIRTRRIPERNEHSGPDQENAPKNDGKEADSFTYGGDKEEDLDCVQGLLSLSQGAWR